MLVGALGVGFEYAARSGAVDHNRDAVSAVESRVRVQRATRDRYRLAEHDLAVPLQRTDQGSIGRKRFQGLREQQPANLDANAEDLRRRFVDHPAHVGLDIRRRLLRDHPPVELQHDLAGNDVGVRAALDATDVEVRVRDARDARSHRPVARVLRVSAFRIDVAPSSASMPVSGIAACAIFPCTVTSSCRQPLCAVTTCVAKPARDQVVRLRELLPQQPRGAELAADLLVVGEVQLDAAPQRRRRATRARAMAKA